MGRILLLWVLIGCLLSVDMATAPRGGGGRGGFRRLRIKIPIPRPTNNRRVLFHTITAVPGKHHKAAHASNYDHTDEAKIIKSSNSKLDYVLGQKITFFCVAQGDPPPRITWFKDGNKLHAHQFLKVHEWQIGKYITQSKMEINRTTHRDAGYYQCQADNKYAIDKRGFRTDYVTYT